MNTQQLKKLWNSSLIRFGMVGVLNTLVGTTIMFVLYNKMHCTYWQSSSANYFFGSILSFFLNKHFTFRSKGRSLGEIVRFVVNIAVCYSIAYGVAKPLMLHLLEGYSVQVRENVAMLVGMVFFVGLNYLGQRFFTFRSRGSDPKDKKKA